MHMLMICSILVAYPPQKKNTHPNRNPSETSWKHPSIPGLHPLLHRWTCGCHHHGQHRCWDHQPILPRRTEEAPQRPGTFGIGHPIVARVQLGDLEPGTRETPGTKTSTEGLLKGRSMENGKPMGFVHWNRECSVVWWFYRIPDLLMSNGLVYIRRFKEKSIAWNPWYLYYTGRLNLRWSSV